MNGSMKSPICLLFAAMVLCAFVGPPAKSQDSNRGTAVVFPVVFSRDSGSQGSRDTAVQAVGEVLQKGGYTLVSGASAATTWKQLRLPMPSTDSPARMKEIVQFGKEMKARFVVAPTFDFHSRSIWVDLGPKTVSTATVSIKIIDVQTAKVVYSKSKIEARSDEKFNAVKAGADILISPLVSVVSGGPKTPHEQRAVQIAVTKALRGWIAATR